MKVATKLHLATNVVLGMTLVIGLAVWWTHRQIDAATRADVAVTALARTLSELRLVSFEYMLHREARPKAQWMLASDRLDEQLTDDSLRIDYPDLLPAMLKRREKAKRFFTELTELDGATDERKIIVVNQFLINQQENLAAVYEMNDRNAQRIVSLQDRAYLGALAGLVLIAFVAAGAALALHQGVLRPIQRLQATARKTASGGLAERFETPGTDELSQLGGDLNAMTDSLRTLLAEREQANARLEALNRELESFSYSVSHDLRGPLRSMDGFSLWLLEDYSSKLDADGVDALQRIRAASQRMGVLIDNLLALSQITRSELVAVPVDLRQLACEISQSIDRENKDKPINWHIDDHINVRGDRNLLHIALSNLMRNSWKFSSKVAYPAVSISQCERAGRQWVSVSDNGAGFDMAFADRLFGAFQRLHTTAEFPGTGIGLAIVQRVIQRHGGKVEVDAAIGQGARFYFHLGD